MFSLSTKSDYGLLLVSLLARERGKRYAISAIAKEYKLPYAFLSRIAAELVNASILNSKEGVHGGYTLTKDPAKIPITEVIEALDGPWAPTVCTGKKGGKCKFEAICPAADHWKHHLQGEIWQLLARYSVADIAG